MDHTDIIKDTDAFFEIDPITRVITNKAPDKTKVMQYDHNSERFTFCMPQFVEGHDMLGCKVEVRYINIDTNTKEETKGLYEVKDVQMHPEDKERIVFSWLLSQNVTKRAGVVHFLVRFSCVAEDTTIDYAWSTEQYRAISVAEGIYDVDVIEELYADVFEQWKAEILAEVGDVKKEVDEAKETALEEINATRASAVNAVRTRETKAKENIDAAEATAIKEIQEEGQKVVDSLPDEYADLQAELATKADKTAVTDMTKATAKGTDVLVIADVSPVDHTMTIKTRKATPGISVYEYGQNIWDEQTNELSSPNRLASDRINVFSGATYFLHCENWNNQTPLFQRIEFFNNLNAVMSTLTSIPNDTEIVVPSNTIYMVFYLDVGYGVEYKNDICINLSDERINGTYAPYQYKYHIVKNGIAENVTPFSPVTTLYAKHTLSPDGGEPIECEYNRDINKAFENVNSELSAKSSEVAGLETRLSAEIDEVETKLSAEIDEVEAIAKGRASGHVFDTVADMQGWLANSDNVATLKLGDNLYIRATDVPDYWWDGTSAQVLETQKVDLNGYAKTDDIPTAISDLVDDTDSAPLYNAIYAENAINDWRGKNIAQQFQILETNKVDNAIETTVRATGGILISNVSPISYKATIKDVSSTGKVIVYGLNMWDGEIDPENPYICKNYIEVAGGIRYYLRTSLKGITVFKSIYYYDKNFNEISNEKCDIEGNISFYTPFNCYYIKIEGDIELKEASVVLNVYDENINGTYKNYVPKKECAVGDEFVLHPNFTTLIAHEEDYIEVTYMKTFDNVIKTLEKAVEGVKDLNIENGEIAGSIQQKIPKIVDGEEIPEEVLTLLKNIADGVLASSFGLGTRAIGPGVFARGLYNIADNPIDSATGLPTYLDIVGNGYGEDVLDDDGNVVERLRSNAYMLDRDGNAFFLGDVYVGKDRKRLQPEESWELIQSGELSEEVASLDLNGFSCSKIILKMKVQGSANNTTDNAPLAVFVNGTSNDYRIKNANLTNIFRNTNEGVLNPCISLEVRNKSIIGQLFGTANTSYGYINREENDNIKKLFLKPDRTGIVFGVGTTYELWGVKN